MTRETIEMIKQQLRVKHERKRREQQKQKSPLWGLVATLLGWGLVTLIAYIVHLLS